MYRSKPLLDLKAHCGQAPYFKYISNCITGWRENQEDRIVCLPEFFNEWNYFAVFDGHGGQAVAEYLKEHLHEHLIEELKEKGDDIELAIFISFLSADETIKHLTKEELIRYDPDLAKEEFDILDPQNVKSSSISEGLKMAISSEVEKHLRNNKCIIKSIIASSKTFQKLFTEQLDDEDDDDEDYDENMDESSKNDDSADDISSSDENEEMDTIKSVKDEDDTNAGNNDMNSPATNSTNELSVVENQGSPDEEMDIEIIKPVVGYTCGSTATAVIFNKKKLYVCNVGDSRCIASVNNKAVELSVDHRPTQKEELSRIKEAGFKVTQDCRINGELNMSRACGDFQFKKACQSPFEAVICEPSIYVIDVEENLDFVFIASDGIWDVLSSQDIVDFIHNMKKDDANDILEELFHHLLPSEITDDGTGCDNMSGIIIFFEESKVSCINTEEREPVLRNFRINRKMN